MEGMEKQTAVEWLAEQIKDYDCAPITNNEEYAIVIPVWIFKDKLNQAKAMEKKQIIEAHFNGCETGEMFNNENRAFITDSEQYYNKTFKSE